MSLSLAYTTRRVAPLDARPYTEYLCALGQLTVACVRERSRVDSRERLTLNFYPSNASGGNLLAQLSKSPTVLARMRVPLARDRV